MFCTQCGKAAASEHVFCAGCGTKLLRETGAAPVGPIAAVSEPATAPVTEATSWEDWRETTNYRVVLGHPEVKALIADAAKVSKAGMTGDEFLKLAQPILDASGSGGVPMKLIAEIATPLYAKMGVKTGKDAKNGYATTYGRTLGAILCSLASRNQTLVAVHEGTDGCVVQAEIPSSMTTWKGKLSLTLERKAEGTLVSSAVVFEGQSSDWGRSKRILDDLHQDILNYRSLQP
ncbi:hypothetical protein [Hyphomonas sp.]|jgi:hypothetical protein|uniref:hypothetical protein n=1 Tax=Hyphomonas sp. TaxID=87 RepID=UPI0025B81170|nr:hypothetical protein [Hyphomonas sp.]